jgi:hypothetical protein
MASMTDPGEILDAMRAAVTALEPLENEEQAEALRWIAKTLKVSDVVEAPIEEPIVPNEDVGGDKDQTPKAFMAEKRPSTDLERYTCLAYYLTHHKGTQEFKTRDISKLNTEAAQPKMSNASQVGKDAVKAKLLAGAGGGKRQITDFGERVVRALPDKEAVKAVRAEVPKPRRRSRKSKAS